MEVLSLLDGDVQPVLQPMIQKYSTKGKLLGVTIINLEVELTTFVYLMNLSFSPIHLVCLIASPIFMEQSIKLKLVLYPHLKITMSPMLCFH